MAIVAAGNASGTPCPLEAQSRSQVIWAAGAFLFLLKCGSMGPDSMSENSLYFSSGFVALWEKLQPKSHIHQGEDTIQVGRTLGAFGFYYERIRQVVDYQEDHLFRRLAIERMVRRLSALGGPAEEQAETLIKELVMARYLPNDVVPLSAIGRTASILQKYHAWQGLAEQKYYFSLLAREVDAALSPPFEEDALISFLLGILAANQTEVSERTLRIEAGLRRILFRLDEGSLLWFLAKRQTPRFVGETMPDAEVLQQWTASVARSAKLLASPIQRQVCKILRPLAGPALLLVDLAKQSHGAADLENKERFHSLLTKILSSRFERAKGRRARMVWRSLLYILITKVFLLLLVEIPYERLVFEHLRYLPLGINILFPPLFLLLVVSGLKSPKGKEIAKLEEVLQTMIREAKLPVGFLKPEIQKRVRFWQRALFWVGYAIVFGGVFGGVAWLLRYFKFQWPHYFVFYFFVCTVGYFGFRVRQAYREMVLGQEVDGFRGVLFDFLALPFIRVGRWLSRTISKLNVFVFILDIFIEAPYKILLEWIESWFGFIRERRDELISKE